MGRRGHLTRVRILCAEYKSRGKRGMGNARGGRGILRDWLVWLGAQGKRKEKVGGVSVGRG